MMVDWGFVWGGLNSNLVALIFAAIIGVIGAFFLERFTNRRKESTERKSLAVVLGYEIAQMKQVVQTSVARNRTLLEKYRADSSGEMYFLHLTDMDLFRTIYDRPSTNLSLLPPELVPTISDVYRIVELCNHLRRLANDVSAQGSGLLATLAVEPRNALARREVEKARTQFISYSDNYLRMLGNLATKCAEAIQGLSKIVKIDESKVFNVIMFSPDTKQGEAPR
ncbi:MAG: hypothetical protein ACLQEQ_09945 [Nitrososphaerales archaeon]